MSLANLRGVERDPQQHEDWMLRRTLCSMVLVFATTPAAVHAQIGRQRPVASADPGYWVGLSIGYVEGISTTDEATGATWRFGYTSQVRATVEKTLAQGMTFGVAAGYSNAPLTYSSASQFNGDCPGSCLANADITQYLAFVRGGGGAATGFRGTFSVEGGVTQFSKFRDRATKQSLPPANGSYDMTFGFGAGFGYRMSRLSELYIDQSYDFVFHKQSASVTNQTVPRLLTFRGGIRFGF